MRRRVLLCVLALVAAACGGDDDTQSSAADANVIQSDDGRATLTLPDGVDGDGITVEALDVEGAIAAYELLPAGTTFDEPATLTVTDLEVESGVPVIAILESGDEGDVLDDVTTTFAEDGAVTAVLPIPHFSTVTIGGLSARAPDASFAAYTGALAAPPEVAVNVPFEVAVALEQLASGTELEIPWENEVIELERSVAIGSLAATNATPAMTGRLPASGELSSSYRGSATLRCQRAGQVGLTWTVRFTFSLTGRYYFSLNASGFERSATLEVHRLVACGGGTTTTSSTTTTTADPARSKPTVSEITIGFARPTTTYSVVARAEDGSALTYTWRLSGEDCGTPRTPWEQTGQTVTWRHSDAPPDSCPHQTEDHDVTGSVTIRSATGGETTCTFGGSANRTITDPPCT